MESSCEFLDRYSSIIILLYCALTDYIYAGMFGSSVHDLFFGSDGWSDWSEVRQSPRERRIVAADINSGIWLIVQNTIGSEKCQQDFARFLD